MKIFLYPLLGKEWKLVESRTYLMPLDDLLWLGCTALITRQAGPGALIFSHATPSDLLLCVSHLLCPLVFLLIFAAYMTLEALCDLEDSALLPLSPLTSHHLYREAGMKILHPS